jgi:hypothetical protein
MENVLDTLPQIVAAIGGLGVASFALVDACKALPGGGPSRIGFSSVAILVETALPTSNAEPTSAGIGGGEYPRAGRHIVLSTLEANWINGMAMADQKAIARSLIKLYMRPESVESAARHLGVSAENLAAVAKLWRNGPSKDSGQDPSAAVVGRIDLALTALIDGAYQRADQRYRNMSKFMAGVVAVLIATVCGAVIYEGSASKIFLSFVAGLLAVPLAPLSKDLTSALQAGVKVAQALRK